MPDVNVSIYTVLLKNKLMPSKKTPKSEATNSKDKEQPTRKKFKPQDSADLTKIQTLANLFRKKEDFDKSKLQVMKFVEDKASELLDDNYNLIFLYDAHDSISEHTADRIYDSLRKGDSTKVLLSIHSGGGRIEPAYLISKCCRDSCEEFHVCVPRRAKSAATLIALGAHKIHMGMMSELGPIDPQINGLPALGLNNALKSITDLTSENPEASDMLAQYLQGQLPIQMLGYFERVSESATQYAVRLLRGVKDADRIAHKLVYEYKDHAFVIDKEEAVDILGDKIVSETSEYTFAKLVHSVFDNLSIVLDVLHNRNFSFVGGGVDDMTFLPQNKNDDV